MSLSRYALRTAGFAALYVASVLAGEATELRGVPVFWPAAAVGAVWLVAQARFGLRRFDVIAMVTVSASLAVLDHGFFAALVHAIPEVVPALLFAFVLDRWLPGYWLGHGDRFRRQGPALAKLAAAAAAAAAAGAILHGVVAPAGAFEAGYAVLRDTAAVLLVVLLTRTARLRRATPSQGPGLTVVR